MCRGRKRRRCSDSGLGRSLEKLALRSREDQSSVSLQRSPQCDNEMLDKGKYVCKSQNQSESGHTGFRMMFLEALGFYRGEYRKWVLGTIHHGGSSAFSLWEEFI